MGYNDTDQSRNLECRLLSMLKYIKAISCAAKQPSKYSNGFQPFPGAEACGKIAANDSSGSMSPCSHSCTAELQITVDRSICVTSVHCLDSSFFCPSKVGSSARYHRK